MLSPKGISPLVAAVLLIAITMTVAGGLAFFAQSLISNKLTESSNQTIATTCLSVKMQVYACSFDSGKSQLNIILNNYGTVEVKNVTAFFFYANGSSTTIVDRDIGGPVAAGFLKSFSVSSVDGNYTKISVRVPACPDFAIETTCK